MADPDQDIQEDDASSVFVYEKDKPVEFEDEKPGEPRRGCSQVFRHYDWSFLICVGVANFAQGFRRLLELGLYFVFKEKLGLQPGEITLLLGIMAFPMSSIVTPLFRVFPSGLEFC